MCGPARAINNPACTRMRIACVCVRARAPLRVDAYVRLARSWRPVRLAEVMTARAVMFVLLSVTIVEAVVAEEVVPLVLWHGIGEGKSL